jgi:hypothetical protein
MNAPLLHTQAAGFARRLTAVSDDKERITTAFRLLYQRQPTSSEYEQGTSFVNEYPGSLEEKWSAYARVLLAANEFLYLD